MCQARVDCRMYRTFRLVFLAGGLHSSALLGTARTSCRCRGKRRDKLDYAECRFVDVPEETVMPRACHVQQPSCPTTIRPASCWVYARANMTTLNVIMADTSDTLVKVWI